MNERPILFTGEMVRAILNDRKTQTRRVVKPQPIRQHWIAWNPRSYVGRQPAGAWEVVTNHANTVRRLKCPYGATGDRLWVRETHLIVGGKDALDPRVIYRADGEDQWMSPVWSPSIHMPRWASRLTLEVTNVRVQRVQEINHADAIAEGIDPQGDGAFGWDPPDEFRALWDSINAKRGYSWESNPWVWAITFRRVADRSSDAGGE